MAEPVYNVATAYHEAGHAVVALVLGRPVQRVSILPDRVRLGHCEFKKGKFKPSEDWLEREILIALGGVAAEARLTGEYAWGGASQDYRYVHGLAVQRAGAKQAPRLEQRLLAKAEHILGQESNWRAVELIAAELLVHGVLSGRAAQHFFDRGSAAC